MVASNLYYEKREQWYPLPQWGEFFFELGYALGLQDEPEKRVIAGLALPTRAYAASLVAAGVVTGRLSSPSDANDALRRFQQVTTLDTGTILYYRSGGKRKKVSYEGLDMNDNDLHIKLRTGDGELRLIPPSLGLQIEIPRQKFTSLPKLSHRQGNATLSPFLAHFLDEKAGRTSMMQSYLECIIFGSIGRVEGEVFNARFAVRDSKGGFIPGTLQDIIRLRKFSTGGNTYRSDVYYVHHKEELEAYRDIPAVIVFDGAKSFLTWNAYWHFPHCIIILDQTEPDFDVAVDEFNQAFIKNHLDDMTFELPAKIPKEVPLSIYQETRK